MRTTLSQKERKVVESENSAIDPILDVRMVYSGYMRYRHRFSFKKICQ